MTSTHGRAAVNDHEAVNRPVIDICDRQEDFVLDGAFEFLVFAFDSQLFARALVCEEHIDPSPAATEPGANIYFGLDAQFESSRKRNNAPLQPFAIF